MAESVERLSAGDVAQSLMPNRLRGRPGLWTTIWQGLVIGGLAAALCLAVQLPLWRDGDRSLALANALVTSAFAVAAAFVGRHPRHVPTRVGLLGAAVILPLNWVNEWHQGVWPVVAALVGPAGGLCAIWAMLRYPVGWPARRYEVAVVLVLLGAQAAAEMPVLFSLPQWHGLPAGTPWMTLRADRAWFRTSTAIYNFGGAAVALAGAIGIAIRLLRLRDRDRRAMRPVLVAVVFSGVYTILSNLLAAAAPDGPILHAVYAGEQLAYTLVPLTLAVSAVWRWSMQADVAVLAGLVGRAEAPTEVRRMLRDLLEDQELEVFYRLDETLVDVDGRAARANPQGTVVKTVGVPSGAEVVVVAQSTALTEYGALLDAALTAAALTLDNSALQAAVTKQIVDVTSSAARLNAIVSAERATIYARVEAISSQYIEPVNRLLMQVSHLTASGEDDHIAPLIRQVELTRDELSRLAVGAGPELSNGLASALSATVLKLAPHASVKLTPDLAFLPVPAARAIYFAVTELATNAVKHAGAAGLRVESSVEGPLVTVVVTDFGPGGADVGSSGLEGVRLRIESVGGHLDISSPRGGGTTGRVVLALSS